MHPMQGRPLPSARDSKRKPWKGEECVADKKRPLMHGSVLSQITFCGRAMRAPTIAMPALSIAIAPLYFS